MQCNPSRWLWGLIPIAMLAWGTFYRERPTVEADLSSRAEEALSAAGQPWASVMLDGRDATITGRAQKDGDAKVALDTVRGVWGIRRVELRTDLADAPPPSYGVGPEAEREVASEAARPDDDAEAQVAEDAKKAAEAEAQRKAQEEAEAVRLAEAEAQRKAEEDAEAERKAAAEVAALKAKEQAEAKARRDQADAEAARRAQAATKAAIKAQQDAEAAAAGAARAETEAAEQVQADAEAARRAQAATNAAIKAQEEAEAAAAAEAARQQAVSDEIAARHRKEAAEREAQAARDAAAAREAKKRTQAAIKAQQEAEAAATVEKERAEAEAAAEKARAEAEAAAAEETARAEAEAAAAAEQSRAEAAAKKAREAEERAKRKTTEETRACEKRLAEAAQAGVILFDWASADIDAKSSLTIAKLAEIVKGCPGTRVEVEGHTDAEGIPERNQPLSERRARAVVNSLILAGVPEERLSWVGYAAERPVAGNDTPEGRAKNRRIEFRVFMD